MEALVPLLVVVPLAAAFVAVLLSAVLARHAGENAEEAASGTTGILAVLAMAFNLVLAVVLLFVRVGPIYVGGWGGERTLGIELTCDGLAKLMAVTINLVALVSIVFSASYMRRFTKVWLFHALFLLMTGAMNGVVLAGDLFNLFVFLEVAAIASYALVGFGCQAEELEAAFKYLVLGTVGSALILLGVGLLYAMTGQLNMHEVALRLPAAGLASPAVLLAAAALLSGLGLKAAMVPFHAWLPDAHPSAPAPISAMLSGVLIKASGVYVLARLVFNVLGPDERLAGVLIVLGALSMVVGVFLAVGQWDFKRLLAYHSISQMGYVVAAFGVAAELLARPAPDRALAGLCLLGGLFHLVNHAAFKSLLFLSSGAIEQQAHTRQLKQLGGLARRMRFTSFCCRVGALSIAGVPPMNGFFSKLIILLAFALAGRPILAAVAALVALMTLLSFVKVQRYALEGEPVAATADAADPAWTMRAAVGVLAAVCLLAGLAMLPLRDHLLGPGVEALMGPEPTRLAGGKP